MPGPVFPKKVWRGMTQKEIDKWRLKCDRMLDVAWSNVNYNNTYGLTINSIDRLLELWANSIFNRKTDCD